MVIAVFQILLAHNLIIRLMNPEVDDARVYRNKAFMIEEHFVERYNLIDEVRDGMDSI
jgi:hypothetical protein